MCRGGERIPKKIEGHSGRTGGERKEEKAEVISSLRPKYPLHTLLKISGLSRSTYYFYESKVDKDLKNDSIMNLIIEIYYENKGRYGYRRITLELNNRGFEINHKKVLRLMNKMGLHSIVRRKRKYSSYKGTVGKVADNLIERNFEAENPNQKWFTDVTEFNLRGEKLYLSPILDAHARYIVSYNVSRSPNLNQIKDMMDKALTFNSVPKNLIIHSD